MLSFTMLFGIAAFSFPPFTVSQTLDCSTITMCPQFDVLHCTQNDCIVNCNGVPNTCQQLTIKSDASQSTQSLTINCDTSGSCQRMDIEFETIANITVNCNAVYSCQGNMISVSESASTITINGPEGRDSIVHAEKAQNLYVDAKTGNYWRLGGNQIFCPSNDCVASVNQVLSRAMYFAFNNSASNVAKISLLCKNGNSDCSTYYGTDLHYAYYYDSKVHNQTDIPAFKCDSDPCTLNCSLYDHDCEDISIDSNGASVINIYAQDIEETLIDAQNSEVLNIYLGRDWSYGEIEDSSIFCPTTPAALTQESCNIFNIEELETVQIFSVAGLNTLTFQNWEAPGGVVLDSNAFVHCSDAVPSDEVHWTSCRLWRNETTEEVNCGSNQDRESNVCTFTPTTKRQFGRSGGNGPPASERGKSETKKGVGNGKGNGKPPAL